MRGIFKKLSRRHRRPAVTWWDGPLPTGPVRFDPAVHRAGDIVSPPAVNHPPAA